MSVKEINFTRWVFICMLLAIVACVCLIGSYEIRCLMFLGVVLAMAVNCIDELMDKLSEGGIE